MDRSLTVTWEDPFAAFEAGKKLAPIEHLRAIRDGRIPAPPIVRLLGMRLVKVEPGEAVFELMPASSTTTRSAWCTAASRSPCSIRRWAAACRRAARGQGLHHARDEGQPGARDHAEDRHRPRHARKVVHVGKQTATAEARLEDAAGKLYAHGTTTCLILG